MRRTGDLGSEALRARAAGAATPLPLGSDGPRAVPSQTGALVRVAVFGCGPEEAAVVREAAARLGVDAITTAAPASEMDATIAGATRCVSVSHRSRVSNGTLTAWRQAGVEFISSRSIGLDHVDVEFARSIGLTVRNVAYSPDGVADFTAMLILMTVRGARETIRRADDHDFRPARAPGADMRDLTVGVVGTGRIGKGVARRLRAFGCRVLAHDHRPKAPLDYVPLDELLRLSDVVTLHVPLTADTRHLLGRERLARMKPGAVVVNTSRGALVDTAALLEALEAGTLGGAALDVLEGEEAIFHADRRGGSVKHPFLARLQALPNVVVTPHTAFHTSRALREMFEGSLRDCALFASGGLR